MRDFLWPISNIWNHTWAPEKTTFIVSTTHAIQGLEIARYAQEFIAYVTAQKTN